MPKAKPLDRLELTRRKMAFKEMMKHADEVPPATGVIEHMNDENFDGVHCPYCGAVMKHIAGCLECPNKCWSKCG